MLRILALATVPFLARAQSPDTQSAQSACTEVSRLSHSRVMQRVLSGTDPGGDPIFYTNAFTEIATGLSHLSNGQWVAASDVIQITPQGGAATNAQHSVFFSANLNSGGITVALPDGQIMRGAPSFLSYFDGDNIAVIAQLRDSIGELLPSLTQVVYTNAFSNLLADVEYVNKLSGLEQFVILREMPPSPGEFNLGQNGQNVRLQVWTAFSSAPTPQVQTTTDETTGLETDTLDFGAMTMPKGTAFMAENGTVLTPTFKHWTVIQGQVFLVEEVPLNAIQSALQSLPPYSGPSTGSLNPRSAVNLARAFVPPHPKTTNQQVGPLRLAKTTPHLNGFVVDFALLNNSQTNFTFSANSTFFITNTVNLFGVTTVEGGTCIKFATNAAASIVVTNIVWNTSPYRMASFTSQFDDTIGSQITGSTGNPTTNLFGGVALDVSGCAGSVTITNARFSFLRNAINGTTTTTVMNAQFNRCSSIFDNSSGTFHLFNVLGTKTGGVQNQPCVSCSGVTIDAENVTFDNCSNFVANPGTSTISLTNCLFTAVTNWTGGTVTTNSSAVLASDSGVFQSAGAGYFYLANNSPYRAAGTENVNSALLASLDQSSTFPPLLSTNTLTNETVLTPQAQRDTSSTPDLGYHYPAIDYVSSCAVSNTTLVLTNGVVLAYYGNGIWLQNGGQLVSQGTPNQPNRLVYYNYVQEQATNLWSSVHGAVNAVLDSLPLYFYEASLTTNRNVDLRFTTISGALGANYSWDTDGANQVINLVTLQDCEFNTCGSEWYMVNDPTTAVITLQNDLFLYPYIHIQNYAAFNAYNCLFTGSNANLIMVPEGSAVWLSRNNAFDGVYVANLDSTFNHSAFLNSAHYGALRTGDLVTNVSWVAGPLGNYYQPTTSPLINAGNTTADLLGLYHYTTTTNEVKETNSTVDIGYHYVALGINGLPVDTVGSGTPDYLKDANGNGVVDSGEINWLDPNDLGLVVIITRPLNNSVIP